MTREELLNIIETDHVQCGEAAALARMALAFYEWHEKTAWVQTDKRFDVLKSWGKHRADVLKEYIEHLENRITQVPPSGMLKIGYMFITAEGGTVFSISDTQIPNLTLAGPVYAPVPVPQETNHVRK